MRCALLFICAGIASAIFISDIPLALSLCLSSVAILLFLILLIELFGFAASLRRLFVALLLGLLGLCWHLNWANNRLAERLPAILEGKTLQIEGVVVGLPERSSIAQKFHFKILRSPSGFFPRKVLLNYYGSSAIIPGQYWRFSVRLNRPHGFSNPGVFDYEAWLFQQGISARGYVRDADSNQLITGSSKGAVSSALHLHTARYSLKMRLQEMLNDFQYAGLLIALLIGDGSSISQEYWSLFGATGSNHLFVISGLHIGMVSGFVFWLALVVGKLLHIAPLFPAQKFAAFSALTAALMYALLAGFSLPTQRAFIMTAALFCGLFWNVRYQISFRLLLAAFVVLLLNPLAMINSGFWLSFIAVLALFTFAVSFQGAGTVEELEVSLRKRLDVCARFLVWPQLVVFIALAVPLIYFTQQLTLLAPVVNIVAIPVIGFLVVPLSFLALFISYVHEGLAFQLFNAAHAAISLLIQFMEFLLVWFSDSSQLQITQPSNWNILALFFAVLLILLPKGVCRRALALPLLFCVLPIPQGLSSSPVEDALRLHVLDVGQGLAVIVQTRSHTLLYDTGANLSPDFNVGAAVVVPVLRALGIGSLDAVVVSHGDNDHAGGLTGVQSNIEIGSLISNVRFSAGNLSAERCRDTGVWVWDDVEFRFLQSGANYTSENNSSCVLQIRHAMGRVLLPGDIEREAEAQLTRRYGAELSSELLLAPHHGSLSSSSYAFIKHVEPEYVVFSTGYRNSFGHPHERVLERYGEFDSKILTTTEAGMISFRFGERSSDEAGEVISNREEARGGPIVHISEYRKQNSRYWH